jgi:transcriptional regulator GlxA family with amidase domain
MIFAHSDAPLNVTLLLFPGLSLLSLAATLDPMRGANRVLGRPAYCWKLTRVAGCRYPSTAPSIPRSNRTHSS